MDNKQELKGFYINTAPVKWPVIVRVPVDGGEFANHEFAGLFARLGKDEVKALEADNLYDQLAADAGRDEIEAAVLADNIRKLPHYLVGWEGVRGGPAEDSPAVPYSVETLVAQLRGPDGEALAVGLWHAVNEMRMRMRLGNFVPSRAPGRDGSPGEQAVAAP